MDQPNHPRAVCLFWQREDGLILAVSRKEDKTKFGLPGGKVDPGETPEKAIAREVWEETGVTIKGLRPVFTRLCPGEVTYTSTTYFASDMYPNPDTSSFRTDEEGIVAWVTPQMLLEGPFGDYNRKLFDHIGVKY